MRLTLGLAAFTAVVSATLLHTGHAETGHTAVPATRVGYNKIVVNGATLYSLTHATTTGGATITGSDVVLVGKLKHNTVREHFDVGATATCASVDRDGPLSRFHCAGLSQSTTASSILTIDVT